MPRLLRPFAALPVKLLALNIGADRNLLLQFPAGIPQATFLGAAVPLENPMGRPRDPSAKAGAWHHGGINE
jgi:hypothetical protein